MKILIFNSWCQLYQSMKYLNYFGKNKSLFNITLQKNSNKKKLGKKKSKKVT